MPPIECSDTAEVPLQLLSKRR